MDNIKNLQMLLSIKSASFNRKAVSTVSAKNSTKDLKAKTTGEDTAKAIREDRVEPIKKINMATPTQ